ncbi:MAG TPA: glycosyltransferase 87 family protein [Actinomycetota bacterium]|nr:glycosyltransferase 87 family protein [Actinomycetota bacterium]
MRGRRRASSTSGGLGLVLVATVVTLGVGYLIKLPCADGDWRDERQYRRLCYSDVVPLYSARGLDRGLVPYLEAENEYPVLTGLSMSAAEVPAGSHASFFNWTVLILTLSALTVAWALHRMVGRRALFFALAPTLAAYGFMNWDLIAVALATLSTLAYLRERDRVAGILLGLGIAAKLYPILLLIPFAAGRIREGRPGRAIHLAGWTAASWAVVNLPFMILAPERWSFFFRLNTTRPADWDTVWLLPQYKLGWSTSVVNILAGGTFVALAAGVWILTVRRRPDLRLWTLGFPILVLFLLTSKVYSPQFSLWLLPWFALTLPDIRLFMAFQAADVAVFVTRFSWFADFAPGDLPSAGFQLALLARALVLLVCVVAWIRGKVETSRAVPEPAVVTA